MTTQANIRFKNLNVRREKPTIEGAVNIHNNSTLKDVKDLHGHLYIDFEFTCHYEPDIGTITIEGEMTLPETEENIARAIEGWEMNAKNLPTDIAEKVHNAILSGCIVEAVILSKEVGLPAPMPTPTVSLTKKEKKEIKISADETKHYIR